MGLAVMTNQWNSYTGSYWSQITLVLPSSHRLSTNIDTEIIKKVITKIAVANRPRPAWILKNRSWAAVDTLCLPLPCLLTGEPYCWNLDQALVMTVYTKCYTNLTVCGTLLHHPYSPPHLCYTQMPSYHSVCHVEVTNLKKVWPMNDHTFVMSAYNNNNVPLLQLKNEGWRDLKLVMIKTFRDFPVESLLTQLLVTTGC